MCLCKSCKNSMRVKIEGNTGTEGITKVMCLINESVFNLLWGGCYNKEYPKVVECSKFEKLLTREEYIKIRECGGILE